MDDKVTIYSALSGRPFEIRLESYPYHELPRLSDEDIKDMQAKVASGEPLSELELTLARAENERAKRKVAYYRDLEES